MITEDFAYAVNALTNIPITVLYGMMDEQTEAYHNEELLNHIRRGYFGKDNK